MIAYTRERLTRLFKFEFLRFCIVGGTGFVINFIILSLLHKELSFPIYLSQLIGSEIALFSNFMMHHHWTYKRHNVNKSIYSLIVQFHVTSWPAILGSTLMVSLFEKLLHFNNFKALLISSAIALLWNFVWSKFVIWKDVSPKEVAEIAHIGKGSVK